MQTKSLLSTFAKTVTQQLPWESLTRSSFDHSQKGSDFLDSKTHMYISLDNNIESWAKTKTLFCFTVSKKVDDEELSWSSEVSLRDVIF